MTDTDVSVVARSSPFTVLNVVLGTGERLPCLVQSTTWLPVRIATRWAVRYRRYRVQSSTLANNLRVLARVYRWAKESAGYDLDNHLTQGQALRNREIESLASTLRSTADDHALDTGAFDQHLSVVEDFLKWSLDSENRGGRSVLSLEQLTAERGRLDQLFRSLRVGSRPSARIEPLEDKDIEAIRHTIGPIHGAGSQLSFPPVFSPHARLRNWLMFEVALELGIRRGELLKLRLDSLPRAADDGIRILRRPDDPHDSRSKEPAVKTAERVIPASRELLRAVQAYLTSPSPLGRVSGKSPYLFVTRSGSPVSIDTADDIIVAIGRAGGVEPLSWHRLRHTWAERMSELFAEQQNGMDRLVYLGGWTNPLSARRYIQRTLAKQAREALRGYHQKLYEEAAHAEDGS
ncbi:MAG TPA: tyrosine-type recombinase/integrase [Nitrospira sp.]|nr:tyrosine-type recombinase/integrase [Nitrospira sp.]